MTWGICTCSELISQRLQVNLALREALGSVTPRFVVLICGQIHLGLRYLRPGIEFLSHYNLSLRPDLVGVH